MKMTAKIDSERFQSGVNKYAGYLETPDGRWRSDLAFANLQDFLPVQQGKEPLLALDLGAGTGATAVRLARLGIHVTLLDSSPAMLELAKRTGQEAGVTEKIVLKQGDAVQLNKSVSRSIVRCNSLPQYSGICRGPGNAVARCRWRVARFIGGAIRRRAQPGRRSIKVRYLGG